MRALVLFVGACGRIGFDPAAVDLLPPTADANPNAVVGPACGDRYSRVLTGEVSGLGDAAATYDGIVLGTEGNEVVSFRFAGGEVFERAATYGHVSVVRASADGSTLALGRYEPNNASAQVQLVDRSLVGPPDIVIPAIHASGLYALASDDRGFAMAGLDVVGSPNALAVAISPTGPSSPVALATDATDPPAIAGLATGGFVTMTPRAGACTLRWHDRDLVPTSEVAELGTGCPSPNVLPGPGDRVLALWRPTSSQPLGRIWSRSTASWIGPAFMRGIYGLGTDVVASPTGWFVFYDDQIVALDADGTFGAMVHAPVGQLVFSRLVVVATHLYAVTVQGNEDGRTMSIDRICL